MAAPDRVPDAEEVAVEVGCCIRPRVCVSPERCWSRGRCSRMADRKSAARKKDIPAMRAALRDESECRGCGGTSTEGHHVVFRSQGGDDVRENIAGLCNLCHTLLHNGDDEATEAIGAGLSDLHVAYCLSKLGVGPGREYLARRYRRTLTDNEVARLRPSTEGRD